MRRFFVFSFTLLFAITATKAQGKFNYTEQWKTIDKLMEGILPQSALPEIEKVRQAALKDKTYGQLIKAVMTRNACLQQTEENPQVAVINSLKKDIETIPFPAKAVIYSLTGEACLDYYNRNRWKIHDRTALTDGVESNDIETWDAARLMREAVHYYQLSLDDATLLQKIPIGNFKEALEGDASTRYLRPTLYDFLAHRTIDAYMNNQTFVHYSEHFAIDRIDYLGDAQAFSKVNLVKTDTLSFMWQAMKLFQDLTIFRLTQKDINALTDVDLKRLKYVKDQGNYLDINKLYEDAMRHLITACAGQKIWGKAAYTLALYYKQEGQIWENSKSPGHKRYFVEAVSLCREIEKNAQVKDDRKLAADMIKELSQPDVNILIDEYNIPHKPMLALIKYKNLQAAYLSIYHYDPENFANLFLSGDVKPETMQDFLSAQEKVASHVIGLPVQTDYQQHSFETKIDSLPLGTYLLVVSDKPNPEKEKLSVLTYKSIQVTSMEVLQRVLPDGGAEVYIVNAGSGKPLANVTVDVMQRDYDENQKYTYMQKQTVYTDSCGIANILPVERYNDRKLRIIHGNDTLTKSMLYIYPRGKTEQPEVRRRTVIFTDRAIYRPGQTVYFKGVMYEADKEGNDKILPQVKTNVQLMDVNGKEVMQQSFTTNEYGSFNGVFTLPQGQLNGQMHIKNESGEVYVYMEEYKRPTFEVSVDPVAGNNVLGDTITITGEAKALAGYVVDGAKVVFDVMRYMEMRTFRAYIPNGRNRHIASGTLYTDNKGQFIIKFSAKDDDIKKDDNNIYTFQVAVDITDMNGETQKTAQNIRLSRKPLHIDCKIPEKITIGDQSSDNLTYTLKTTTLNGNVVAADVQVDIYALKGPARFLRDRYDYPWEKPDTFVLSRDEFEKYFPTDPYLGDSDPLTFPRERQLGTFHIKTQEKSKIDLGVLKNEPSGWYCVRIKATGQNIIIADSIYVQLQHIDAPIMNMKEWLAVMKDSGEPGETAIFRVAGGTDSSLVRYDILFKDKIVERKWITVGRIPHKLSIPIEERYRGGFKVAFAMVQDNRTYTSLNEIKVPYTNKELDITFNTFRERLLPGEKEKWTLTVKNKKGTPETAEMVAALYDASLDMFVKNDWERYIYMQNISDSWQPWYITSNPFSRNLLLFPPSYTMDYTQNYEKLKGENISNEITIAAFGAKRKIVTVESSAIPAPSSSLMANADFSAQSTALDVEAGSTATSGSITAIPLRTNFSETAFFYPELRTNDKGEVLVEFTIPEALTRWNMLGFAHTKDFKTGNTTNSLITQKQVAINANLPRFFRVGDTLVLSAKVNNLTEGDLNGKALLRLYDAFTMQPVDAQMLKTDGTQPFAVKAGQSAAVQWRLVVPATLQAVTYRLTAQAGNHTDGEEKSVPVLSNRTLVTETMPFMVRGDQRKDFRFEKLANYSSGTLKHHRLTLEYTSNPAWYAVQALPYLMNYPYECAEQTFARFYANALAATVANSSPKIKQIFNQWRSLPDSKSLISNLEKNQELKQALLEETPWVMQAASETERKKRIGLLFDFNHMANEQQKALDKLKAMQGANGGFPWFAGQPEDRFVTQHIVAGLEHLRNLNALPRTDDISNMMEKAMRYCDERISEDYRNAQKRTEEREEYTDRNRRQINRTQLHYLYACSFSKYFAPDQQAFDFYMQQAEKYWARFNVYEQAMTALIMYRFGKPDIAQNILRSLKERAQMSDDMGMYWADNRYGYFWSESPVETQAMLIEAFNEAGSDTRAVGEMKIWLLRHKQTNDWKTTKATSEAIYAMLSTDDDLLGGNNEPLDIRINGKPLKKVTKDPIRPEAGTGNVSVSWSGSEVSKSLASLRINNPNSTIVWGAMYWQYFEDMDKITSAQTNLQMNKQLFIKRTTNKGRTLEPVTSNNRPQVGDVVTVRMELRADRDFEYVHLKDMRAAGFEPVNTLSGYRFQGGLGYYESIKDASVNFFISYLRKGTYVFEYDLRVSHAGDFSNGITTFQCMYAPEFNAHSEGVRVNVKN